MVDVLASAEQRNILMKAFNRIDLNHDGKISKQELAKAYSEYRCLPDSEA